MLGRADRKGRLAPGYDADLVLLDAPDWRYLAYHLGGDPSPRSIVGGDRRRSYARRRCRPGSSGAAAQKDRRHEYEYVYVDDEGHEVEVDDRTSSREREARAGGEAAAAEAEAKGAGEGRRRRAPREIEPPSWRRVVRSAADLRAADARRRRCCSAEALRRARSRRPGRRAARLLPAVQLLHGLA